MYRIIKDDRNRSLLRFLAHQFQKLRQLIELFRVLDIWPFCETLDHDGFIVQEFAAVVIITPDPPEVWRAVSERSSKSFQSRGSGWTDQFARTNDVHEFRPPDPPDPLFYALGGSRQQIEDRPISFKCLQFQEAKSDPSGFFTANQL